MQKVMRYPDLLKSVLQQNEFENIIDSNMFSAYIPDDLPVPKIDDPRKTQASIQRIPRHPSYIRSAQINQIFSYIGFIKRVANQEYRDYLPLLFRELNRFLRVFEDVVFATDIAICEDIYIEQKEGMQNFFSSFCGRTNHNVKWIEKIWKQQKIYLENIDMLLETLRLSGQVFDFKKDSLHETIVAFCKEYFQGYPAETPSDTDVNFVANCCSKASRDKKPKTIWSGDKHITLILNALYDHSDIIKLLPQIYQRASYSPHYFTQLFP